MSVRGVAIFELVVDEARSVRTVRALRTPRFEGPLSEFERRYQEHFSRWKYRPATRRGTPVAVYLALVFTL
jgi:hypothetical protein